jgi:hypothetical protein
MPPKVKLTRDEVSGRFHCLLRRRGAPRDVILGLHNPQMTPSTHKVLPELQKHGEAP